MNIDIQLGVGARFPEDLTNSPVVTGCGPCPTARSSVKSPSSFAPCGHGSSRGEARSAERSRPTLKWATPWKTLAISVPTVVDARARAPHAAKVAATIGSPTGGRATSSRRPASTSRPKAARTCRRTRSSSCRTTRSHLDVPVLYRACPGSLRMVAKAELFRVSGVGTRDARGRLRRRRSLGRPRRRAKAAMERGRRDHPRRHERLDRPRRHALAHRWARQAQARRLPARDRDQDADRAHGAASAPASSCRRARACSARAAACTVRFGKTIDVEGETEEPAHRRGSHVEATSASEAAQHRRSGDRIDRAAASPKKLPLPIQRQRQATRSPRFRRHLPHELDGAVVLFHDPVDHRQTEAGTARLRREERLEDAGELVVADAGALVA